MCKHFDCIFYAPVTETCDYMLIAGHRRDCPATDDCSHFATELGKEKILRKNFKPRVVDPESLARLEKHYESGITIEKLSKRARLPFEFTAQWMRKVHPEGMRVRDGYYVGI